MLTNTEVIRDAMNDVTTGAHARMWIEFQNPVTGIVCTVMIARGSLEENGYVAGA